MKKPILPKNDNALKQLQKCSLIDLLRPTSPLFETGISNYRGLSDLIRKLG
jgi:hypothetical protein